MDFDLPGGKYVVAVSGGVDSVVLLHALLEKQRKTQLQEAKNPWIEKTTKTTKHLAGTTVSASSSSQNNLMGRTHYEFVVAHFDHGIRPDSAEDRRFVEAMSKHYRLPFLYDNGSLGANASEEAARKARYNFLHKVRNSLNADGIITAHHQDDVVETILLNLIRGTNNRGLHSLKSTPEVIRPFLHLSKSKVLNYAKLHQLSWREDASNKDVRYLRNHIRQNLAPKFGATRRGQILRHGRKAAELQVEIDNLVAKYLSCQPAPKELDRRQFTMLTHDVSKEVLASWLRSHTGVELNSKMLERLVASCKTARSGTKFDVAGGWIIKISLDTIKLVKTELIK